MKNRLALFLLTAGFLLMKSFSYADEEIKQPGLAGTWYPGGKKELSLMLDRLWDATPVAANVNDIGVIVSPHAGYLYAASTAAYGFKSAQSRQISTVIILAPTHHYAFTGASVWAKGAFVTPLGSVPVDEVLAAKFLAADKAFTFRKDVFEGKPGRAENSVETQIPFIQKAFPEAKIVPIILGYPPDLQMIQNIAMALVQAVGDRDDVLVDVSVDQSHFHTLKEANAIDREGISAIEKFDVEAFWNGHVQGRMEVDGFHVVTAAMLYAKARGFGRAELLKYATSAEATNDPSSVVGYASIVFSRVKLAPEPVVSLNARQKKRILEIARTTLDSFVKTGIVPEFNEKDVRLFQEEGAFVTLKKNGQLRGCIGNIIGGGPLYQTVRDMALAAASQDPRFKPVTPNELEAIDVEVSVLSKPQEVKGADEIIMGTHGVIVRQGGRGGVFLPQVAKETGWSKEQFLSELCSQKAGLPADCWKSPGVRLEIFTADVFGEKE